MTINRLRDVLSAIGPPPDARELSEMLWLACHISPTEEQGPAVSPATPPVADGPVDAPSPPKPPEPAPPRPSEPLTGLHPRPAAEAEPVGRASEVLVPTAPMLADPLGVQRALRPLKRRVPSRHRVELDEEATAARVADTRLWTPVLVPSPERWLGLDLVIDTGPTMRLWRPLARELAETLLRQGAFQDVHLSHLDGTGRVSSTPEAPPQDPRTLLDASGRRAVLVLSDCSGPHWWNGRAVQAVRRWAQAGPTAIVQPLAERLWRRTAAPPSPGLAALPRPGAPNTDLRFTPYDGAAGAGVPVPVLEIAPRWFGAWARLVSGADPQPAAVAMLPARPSGTAPVRREQELPIAERVRRFLATASPDAAELAAHVAVSVPSLPVMRLIQHRILGGSGPGRLAEVLLSGLLRPAGGVRYEFVPGAREALLDTLPRPEALHTRHVLEAVSAEIERRAGTSAETFRALLPDDGGPVVLTADTDHFALVTPEARSHLTPGPPPPEMPRALDLLDLFDTPAEELLDEWGEAPREIPIGEDSGGPVTLDVLRTNPELPHGLIIAPPHDRAELVRTTLFSLALTHSPDIVNLVFVGFHGSGGFTGLAGLPHVAYYAFARTHDSPLISMQVPALEDERIRRTRALENAGFSTWDEYQTAIVEGADHAPLPALVIVIDDTGPLLDARPDLIEPLAWLCETGAPLGMRFVFCTSKDAPLPSPLRDHLGWNIGIPGEGVAFLHVFADRAHPAFQPAHIYSDAAHRLIEKMNRQGRRARELPWPEDPRPEQLELDLGEPEPSSDGDVFLPEVPPDAVPPGMLSREFDVLSLNGGGSDGILRETWAMSADTPRSPAIGYRPGGHLLSLYPLDRSSGIPHGLIVGSPAARQRIVRAITLALASGHSPADLQFVFAGLGEHPLGEPIGLPHVRYSEEELLGSPNRLRRFFDFLSGELEARSAPPPQNVPRDSIRATDPWSVDELYERFRQDPHSVDRVWWNFFEDYQPGERPAVPPPEAPPEARPRLVVVADVSLTFPLSRPEIGETLLSLAQRGRALDVQLLLTSSTVENTTIWGRFLPLLGWRIAANRLPPDQLQYVLGQASLEFPADEPTAYLLAGGGAPQRFTLAPEPPRETVDDFVRRTRKALKTPGADNAASVELDDLLANMAPLHVDEIVDGTLRALITRDADALRARRMPRQLILTDAHGPTARMLAERYGQILTDLGVLSDGGLNVIDWRTVAPRLGNAVESVPELFREFRGRVLFIEDTHMPGTTPDLLSRGLVQALIAVMDEQPDDPLVILSCDAGRAPDLPSDLPDFTERFTVLDALGAAPEYLVSTLSVMDLPVMPQGCAPIGLHPRTRRPVFVDFARDRHLLVTGPDAPERANLLRVLIKVLVDHGEARPANVYVLDTHEILRTPTARFDRTNPVPRGVTYINSSEKFAQLMAKTLETPSIGEVYSVVIDRDLNDRPQRALLQMLLGKPHIHLVLAREATSPGSPSDPLVIDLRELRAPAVLLGAGESWEAEVYAAEPPVGPLPFGRGVFVRRDYQWDVQIAELH
ncbi:SAV_2336 N-terminal domain-related protein [Actinomadura sp. K4S16]|uniref:SAV_2336 N-terminal domain-related protein n=1 Tax=Actinomadura sp. K4S16 TaxID=1316147 RepID=UPI0011ECE5A8|nr:SAV_2336 N-terminal domain-related protein [Actinomadura sp. K4S16]